MGIIMLGTTLVGVIIIFIWAKKVNDKNKKDYEEYLENLDNNKIDD